MGSKRGKRQLSQTLYERRISERAYNPIIQSKHLVLYNTAGTHLAASYFSPADLDRWSLLITKHIGALAILRRRHTI